MFDLGPEKLLFVLAIAFVVLGPEQLPDIARKLGAGMRYWHSFQDELRSHAHSVLDVPAAVELAPTTEHANNEQTETEQTFATGPGSFS